MRYTIGDVVDPRRRRDGFLSALAGWWYELPARRRYWWREVLFEPGQGWLRWKAAWHDEWSYDEPPVTVAVWPPLRRLVVAVRVRARWPLTFVSDDRRRLWR